MRVAKQIIILSLVLSLISSPVKVLANGLALLNQGTDPVCDMNNPPDPQANGMLDPQRVYAIVVGLLDWQSPDLSSFSAEGRQDVEFYSALLALGVPETNMVKLIDAEATLARIRQELSNLAQNAPYDSTFIFYFTGHGARRRAGTCFTNHDVQTNDLPNTCFQLTELNQLLDENLFAKNVMLFADCCYSGAMGTVARNLHRAGKNVLAVASVVRTNASTGNWTFTQTLVGCFRGEPIHDRNGDGTITVAELTREIREVMRARDGQLSAHKLLGYPANYGIKSAHGRVRGAWSGNFKVRQYVKTSEGNGRIMAINGDKFTVRFLTYNSYEDKEIDKSDINRLRFRTHSVLSRVDVRSDGRVYPGRVTRVKYGFHKIRYDNYDSYYDEWKLAKDIVRVRNPS